MILFKPEHVEPILRGEKTQTRRLGKRRWRQGALHQCYTRPAFANPPGKPFARVRIGAVRQERLDEITEADARAEGYSSQPEYMAAFYRINGMVMPWEPVWVVTFQMEEDLTG